MSSTALTETTLQGAGIGLMVWTTLIIGARLILRSEKKARIQWDEFWLLAAYFLFVSITGVYVRQTKLMFRLLAVQEGLLAPYEGIADDAFFAQKMFFFTSPGLWLTLWSVKFSLLAFYRRIMVNVWSYIRLWWIVVAYCILTLALSIVLHITACTTLRAWFTAGACGSTPRDIRGSLISFWEAFAVDLSIDLLIMLLPIGLIRNLQMPLSRKIQIGALFSLGIVVMISSIIRVIQVGATTERSNSTPSLTWLALWSVIESSIAIMVGCGPGLYQTAKAAHSTPDAQNYNSRGYFKTSESVTGRRNHVVVDASGDDALALGDCTANHFSRANVADSEGHLLAGDTHGIIRITTSVRVSKEVDGTKGLDLQRSCFTSVDVSRQKK
ncbi:hypothetical protein NX059_004368 [Plenodomus lindquistii]|nr:hypothetical protein NX059_004368 [Plenodomus lindquistii]